jgi:hypothetical protein
MGQREVVKGRRSDTADLGGYSSGDTLQVELIRRTRLGKDTTDP